MGYTIETIEYHQKEIARRGEQALDRIRRQVDAEDCFLSVHAENVASDFDRKAIRCLEMGKELGSDEPHDWCDIVRFIDTGEEIDVRLCRSEFYGRSSYSWYITSEEVQERIKRKYLPAFKKRSRILKELGIEEVKEQRPVKRYMKMHCLGLGGACSFQTFPANVGQNA